MRRLRKGLIWGLASIIALGFGVGAVKATDDIYRATVTIAAPPTKVWQALTEKIHVDRYYLAPLGANITTAGGDLYYGTATQQLIVGEVMTFNPQRELAHSFRFGDSADAHNSLVTYRLTGDGQTTNLQLEHSGFPEYSQDFADIAGGWPIILGGLKRYLEGGSTSGAD